MLPVAVGTVIAERYRVDGILGEGGMGVVVVATHLVLQQRVAIKFLRREAMVDVDAVNRFIREAQAAAKVQSEHVVRVQDVAQLADGTPFIVMEYVDGMVLSTLLASQVRLPVRDAVRFAIQTCEALAEAHAAGIAHGDLKPDNIYIAGATDGARRVKLLDFGISRIIVEESTAETPSLVMGTPWYMPPEQFATGTIDHRADLWALGIVLYEMLSGETPFHGDTPEQIRARVFSESVAPIGRPDMPSGLNEVVLRCLEKDPRDRWPSAVELAAALELYAPIESSAQRLERASLRPGATSTSQRLVPTVLIPSRRPGSMWALAVLGFVGIVGLLFILVSLRFKTTSGAIARPTSSPLPTTNESSSFGATASSTKVAVAEVPVATASIALRSSSSSASASPRIARPRAPHPSAADARLPPTPPAPPRAPPTGEADRFGTRK